MKVFLLCLLLLSSTCAMAGGMPPGSAVEGTLIQVSKLPQAESNPYPDCYYTAVVEVEHILSGVSVPRKIVLVLPGFFSRLYAPEAAYKAGDKVRAVIVPFSTMPDKVRQTQQADEVEDVDLEFYFPAQIAAIPVFQKIEAPVPFAGAKAKEVLRNANVDRKARAARQEAIRHDLEQIKRQLADHGGNWDKWYDSLSDFRAQYKKKFDSKAHLWIGDSYFSAGQIEYGKGYSPEFVRSLIEFNKYLAERDVDLILVRVPQKGEIVDDLFTTASTDQVSNPYLLRMYQELLEADVEIITNAVGELKKARSQYPLMYWYQNFKEEHPAEGTARVIAELLAKRLGRYDKIAKIPRRSLTLRQSQAPGNTFLWPEGNQKFDPTSAVTFTSVYTDQNQLLQLKPGADSPVLVVGSSFIGSPSFDLMGNIPAYLAYVTGVVPDVLYRSGSNATIPRTIAREGDHFLANRSVCIFPLVPWAIHLPLDLPPIVDPNKGKRTPIALYSAKELRSQVNIFDVSRTDAFSYSEAGLTIKSRDHDSREGGKFSVAVPENIRKYPYFTVEINTKSKDAATIIATYGAQKETIHRSYSQSNSEEQFVFQSAKDAAIFFDISNLRPDTPITISAVNIYGLQQ